MNRRTFLQLSSMVLAFLLAPGLAFAGDKLSVKCVNGEFVGFKEAKTGVVAFKGIPFAKAPVGKLRWLPPVEPEPSNEVFEAKSFGPYPLQNLTIEERKAGTQTSEDCLKLNIWASDLKGTKRPVMFYIHGGAYGWEGAGSPAYDGQFIVEQNPDIIVVTNEYRLNTLGFADLSSVPGYTEKYAQAGLLGLLDNLAALKWVQKNIAKFGGDPDNVTIFGESAGGGSVSCLLASKEAKGLFKRVIAQSGALCLTSTQDDYKKLDQMTELMKATGAKNLDDLLALSSDEIKKAWLVQAGKAGMEGKSLVENLQGAPLRGGASIVPADPYKALENGVSKDVDLLIGTTTDEWRYWEFDLGENNTNREEVKKIFKDITLAKKESYKNKIASQNQKYLEGYFKAVEKNVAANEDKELAGAIELINDLAFRAPAIEQALSHIKGGGKAYVYYFGKGGDANPWLGACHASELNYVFHNLDLKMEYVGSVDKALAKKIVTMWANFARTGNPSLESFTWTPYDAKDRPTMVVDKNGALSMENNPRGEQLKWLEKTGLNLKFPGY